MPRTKLSESPYHRTEYLGDENGKVYTEKTFFDDDVAEKNKKNRDSKKVETGDKFPLHRNAELIYLFKINPMQWAHFQARHPDIVKGLRSRDQLAREKAAADIKALHPEWVVAAPRAPA